MIKSMLIAGAGGFAGTCLRYLVSAATKQWFHGTFPLGTFLVNLAGCLLIGVVFGLAEKTGLLSGNHVLLLATGFCGGFTTFSAFANETLQLGTQGHWSAAIFYVVASVMCGVLCVWAGKAVVG